MLHLIWSGILSGLLVIVSGATLSPETTARSGPYCAGSNTTFLQPSCGAGEVIAVESIQHGTKETSTCVLLDKSDLCCQYDSRDCLFSYTDTTLFTGCSGRQVCESNQPNSVDSSICGTDYPDYSHYYTMEYYCIQGSRIATMCSTESKTETGNLLYLKNEITAADTSCTCSVEAKSCDSQINVYLLHLDLSTGTPGDCNSNQKIILTDGETTYNYTCADDNNYNITLKMTSTSNYITVQLDNRDGVNKGAFWIGLEATDSAAELTLDCPAKDQTMCMDCPSLTAPTNGDVSHPTRTYQSVATYSCSTGYTLNGDTTRVCDTDGTWNGSAPTCQINVCPSLSSPTNGVVSSPTITYQSEATYTCDTGYTLNGGATRVCGADKTWSGSEPTCTTNVCPSLIAPANGGVSHPSTEYQSVATYTCDTGYTLNGDTTRVCGATESWNGSEPTCSLKGLGSSCTVDADCTTVISHSTCGGGICSCADGYTQQNDDCEETKIEEMGLGSSCTVDADCTTEIAHSTCADGICSCADGYIQQNDECEETKTKDPEGISIGVIIGIVIAVVVIVIAIIVLLFCCKKRDNREKLSMLWQRIKDKLRSSGEVNASLVHTPNKSIGTKSSTPALETDNANNSSMEQKLKDNDVKEKTKSFTADRAEGEKTPISFSDFREAHLLHSNLNDIPSPIPPSPAQLYPELSSASLFTGIDLQLIEEYPLHPNIPPAATNDMTDTMRVTPESKSDLEQASRESSLSGSVSLPVSVDVSSRQDGGSTVQARELTPVSCP